MWLKRKTRMNRPEQAHCCALMEAVTLLKGKWPELDLLYHIPNGGKRTPFESMVFQGMGVKPGVLDYHLPVARGKYHGLWIEMKAGKNGLTEAQQHWREALTEQNHKVVVTYNAEEALREIKTYLIGY